MKPIFYNINKYAIEKKSKYLYYKETEHNDNFISKVILRTKYSLQSLYKVIHNKIECPQYFEFTTTSANL